MQFAALLLIKWVILTIGATAPLLPAKEIHLQIPIESHFTGESSGLSPLIFRDSKESTVVGFRHLEKILFVQKELKDTRSSLNPLVGNVGAKARSGREAMNSSSSFRSLHSGTHIPTPENMNRPSPDNVKDVSKMMHPPHPESLRDLHTVRGEENDSILGDDHDRHYEKFLDEKGDFVTNDTESSSFIHDSESSFIHETSKVDEKETSFESAQISDKSLIDKHINDSKPSATSFIKENAFLDANSTTADKYITESSLSTASFHKIKIQTTTFRSSDVVENNTTQMDSKANSFELEPKFQVQQVQASMSNNTSQIKVTRKPKPRLRNNRKQKVFLNSASSELPSFNETFNRTFHVSSQTPMLQDSGYQIVTSSTTLFSEKTWFRTDIEKVPNEGTSNQGSEIFIKSSTSSTIRSSSLTTPDSHMNDPPFRGPNVPPDIDHFYKEKERTKMEYYNPAIVETPHFVGRNFGEYWKPEKQILGIAWDCHYFVIGSIFAVIAMYSFVSLLRVNTFITLLNPVYFIVINSIILLLCLLRTFYLFYDPYNLSGKYPDVLASILPKITLPCLTSCFLLLLLSFLNSTKTQFLLPKVQRPCVLAFVIAFYFSMFFCVEIAVCIFHAPRILILIGHLILVMWAKLSSISYFFVFRRLHTRALRKQGEMIRLTFTKMHIDGAQLPKKLPKPTLGLAVKLLLITAILQTFLCLLIPFEMVIFHAILPLAIFKDPWIWWGYQLTCRILELLISAIMSFIATQPQKHFEIGDNRFCSILMWFPCSSFTECFKKEEIMDFEAHSDNYANPQGLRSTGFNLAVNSRRLQTNSLPTFRTPLTEVDKNLPMRTLPCSGRHTNHASAISLLSYYRSKRTLSVSTNEGLEELERTLCNQTISSSDGRNTLRPASMLYKDNGFIRFRRETDPEQPMEMSDEDDHTREDADTSLEDGESTKANVGSSFHSLLEGDVVQNTLSPFFQIGYKRRFRKMSRVSIETTDYSADVSSDQLSNVVNLRNGLSTSALDFHTRKYGSTCSSESAANSFDVTFFLNSNSSPEVQTSPTSTTPASLNVCSAYRSETEDDKTSSVEGHEVMLRSVSPIVKRASSGRLSLNLNLHAAADTSHSNGHVNVACGTEDITPDSAVYLDLQLSRENSMSPQLPTRLFTTNRDASSRCSPSDSFTRSTDGIIPLSPEITSAQQSPSVSPTSQSLGELRTSSSYVVIPRIKKNSRGLLYKLRGSTFSLNAAIYGYEPLEPVEHSKSSFGQSSKKRLERSSSDRRPLSEGQLDDHPQMTPLGEFGNRTTGTGSGFLGDSGLLGDCGVALVDVASQTEESGITECSHKTCTSLMKNSLMSDSQSHLSTKLVDIRK